MKSTCADQAHLHRGAIHHRHDGTAIHDPRDGVCGEAVELAGVGGVNNVYDFHCSNICGLGHWGMDGKLIVEE